MQAGLDCTRRKLGKTIYRSTLTESMSVPTIESQVSESQASEDWATEDDDEPDYGDYYGEEDVDMMATDEGEVRDASFQVDPEHYEFLCLSLEETWNYLDSQARDTSKDIKMDIPSSRTLLHCLRWDQGEVKKRFEEDSEGLMVEAQLRPNKKDISIQLCDACPICFTSTEDSKMYGLSCGHMFCESCWIEYLGSKIGSGQAASIECMLCSVRISLEMISTLLQSKAKLCTKYLHFCLGEYVHSHHLLRWCPGAECSIVFQVKEPQAKKVECSKCKTNCCFRCGEEYHCPTDCETIRQWSNKCHDDSETANYIMANTKDCPKCHTAIEKNGGCNHMCCSRCRHDFCWMCMEEWKSHNGYYNCSKYKGQEGDKANQARQALEKYLFYYQRWANHDQSLKLEEQTKKKILDRIDEKVSNSSGTWIDWQYLLDAVELLRKCRYTLKYTYPYAYYLDGDRKPLFEYQQAQLEVEIENLSWKVERAESTDVGDLRQQMNVAEVKRLTLLRDFVP